MKQTHLALKLKFVECRGDKTYNTKENKKEHKLEAKLDEGKEEEQEAAVPLVTDINNTLIKRSISSSVEVYINNQQI